MDPQFITHSIWSNISSMLTPLWFIPLLAILTAFCILIGHAIIPSLIATGHLPEQFHARRRGFYGLAVLFAAGAIFFLVWTLTQADLMDDFFPRFWM